MFILFNFLKKNLPTFCMFVWKILYSEKFACHQKYIVSLGAQHDLMSHEKTLRTELFIQLLFFALYFYYFLFYFPSPSMLNAISFEFIFMLIFLSSSSTRHCRYRCCPQLEIFRQSAKKRERRNVRKKKIK